MRKIYLFLLSVIFVAGGVNAQISNLCFSASTGTYTDIAGGTPVTFAPNSDDGIAFNIPIGFTFNYLGSNFTQASVNSNGWLSFKNINVAQGPSNANNIALSTNAGLLNTLFPL